MQSEKIKISKVGTPVLNSPLKNRKWVKFVSDSMNIALQVRHGRIMDSVKESGLKFFEASGPREKIYFNPRKVRCGIVTCGGLCPGINDIIREIVIALWRSYGVTEIEGFRYGYRGIAKAGEIPPISLNPQNVDSIHRHGGTILSSSRGPQSTDKMIDSLIKKEISILFTVGGDGTLKGAHEIARRIKERNLKISVAAIPKTIDNDILFTEKTFGFETAVQAASEVIDSAHTEAKGSPNCISIVKLFGRSSGFIAAYTALANRKVNYSLIPEINFCLKKRGGLLEILKKRIISKGHAVLVVAEGAGQDIIETGKRKPETDKSGNIKLKDIGSYLNNRIRSYFSDMNLELNIKYFNPGYMIRSIPANAMDSLYCVQLAQNAVHASMSGRTDLMVSKWNGCYVNIPISMAAGGRKKLNPKGNLWRTVMKATGQPSSIFKY